MSYSFPSYETACRYADNCNISALESGDPRFVFEVERYPNGTNDREDWPWGVVKWERNYHEGHRRHCGFCWHYGKATS